MGGGARPQPLHVSVAVVAVAVAVSYNNINTEVYCYVLTPKHHDYQNRLPRERFT